MPINDVARAAIDHWPILEAITMVAIAGCESGYNARARGDALTIFPPERRPSLRPYACDGFTSFGWYQVHQPAHFDKLERATGSSDPCVWAEHLMDGLNNTRIAKLIWNGSGFGAWTCYNTDAYLAHWLDATIAVTFVLGPEGIVPPVLPDLLQLPPVAGLPPANPAIAQLPPVAPP